MSDSPKLLDSGYSLFGEVADKKIEKIKAI
jgi:hypothetical protein